MAAITMSDDAVKAANAMKVKAATPEEIKKSKKALILRITDDLRHIIIDEGKEILVGDCDNIEDVFQKLKSKLPKDECRYVVVNVTYEKQEHPFESLVFILWIPELAPIRSRMIYESSKEILRKTVTGVKLELHLKTHEEICDRSSLANKLGGPEVKSLEGKPV